MHIQLLYTADCPDYVRAAELIRRVLFETGIPGRLELVPVTTEDQARGLRFVGSPTVRVDGLDLEPMVTFTATDFGLRCRQYRDGERVRGWPGKRQLRDLIEVGWLAERGLLASCC